MTGTCFNQTNFRPKCKLIKGQFTALEKPNKYIKEKSTQLPPMDLFSIPEGKGEGGKGKEGEEMQYTQLHLSFSLYPCV